LHATSVGARRLPLPDPTATGNLNVQ